jgi:hypothetical protein
MDVRDAGLICPKDRTIVNCLTCPMRRQALDVQAACDNHRLAHVLTVDGRQLDASSKSNTNLYRTVRDGDGNLGVMTAFKDRLHPSREVLPGMLLGPAGRIPGDPSRKKTDESYSAQVSSRRNHRIYPRATPLSRGKSYYRTYNGLVLHLYGLCVYRDSGLGIYTEPLFTHKYLS